MILCNIQYSINLCMIFFQLLINFFFCFFFARTIKRLAVHEADFYILFSISSFLQNLILDERAANSGRLRKNIELVTNFVQCECFLF
jgi:hypothetical protein